MSENTAQAVSEKRSRTKKSSPKHRWYFYVGIVCLAVLILLGAFLGFLTVTEYRPQPIEPAEIGITDVQTPYTGEALRILTFNTGYSGLDKSTDFIMDGGKSAEPENAEIVKANMQGIGDILQKADADICLLQEVDKNSSRTFHLNQWEQFALDLPEYETCYAPNFKCHFVPYPLQAPIGSIDGGIATYSRYNMIDPLRHSLPVPFQWPVRTANLKRCLLVSRVPIQDTSKELVLVNLHLEAYDDGEGKIAQTKQLISLLQEEYAKGNYVVAGGDFNQSFPDVKTEIKPTSEWVPGLLSELPEQWKYVYDETVPTCRLLNQPYDPSSDLTQHYVLDGFIVSPNVEVTKVETMDEQFTYSDHNPVVMEIKLK